ncbi:MAG: aspartate kinase [Candidatus Cloacimonetes bacterium]|nr:aspartate kinase [Candidatus Cloacimonadota bacterium]
MALIVKKFGGSSVGSVELIRRIAARLADDYRRGEKIVLVVSAMAKTTDSLFALAHQITRFPSRREMDMLLTAGERISMSLLSLALLEEGVPSISFTGSQSGIITDGNHGNARIEKVNAFRIHEELDKDKIVIVAGFQGVSTAKEITTLGRGGSDTSAVAMACYLNADSCEIYTDVDGVFTADPRVVPDARLIPEIGHKDMLALALSGSKVLHPRAVEYAMRHGVRVEVRSSFTFREGTTIKDEYDIKDKIMEKREIIAIAQKAQLLRYRIAASQESIAMIAAWVDELHKISYIEDSIEVYIEPKYESDFEYALERNKVKILDKCEGLGSVSLIGDALASDLKLMAELLSICKSFPHCSLSQSQTAVEFILPADQTVSLIAKLHDEYLKDKQ